MFILERGTPSEPAKRICAGCPVQAPCEDFATSNHESGVWGGRVHKLNTKLRDLTPTAIEDVRPRPA